MVDRADVRTFPPSTSPGVPYPAQLSFDVNRTPTSFPQLSWAALLLAVDLTTSLGLICQPVAVKALACVSMTFFRCDVPLTRCRIALLC